MTWYHVNSMTFETSTHRVRRFVSIRESYWIAERKAQVFEHQERIGGKFHSQELAQSACERDSYAVASGR